MSDYDLTEFFSPENVRARAERRAWRNNLMDSKRRDKGDGYWPDANVIASLVPKVNHLRQERDNWCGPACMKMMYIGRVGSGGPSQYQYAAKLGIATNSDGVMPKPLLKVWNQMHGYTVGDYFECNIAEGNVVDDIQYSFYDNYPMLFLVQTYPLKRYDYESFHYIVLSGYDYTKGNTQETYQITYNDPNNMPPGHGRFDDSLGNLIDACQENGGVYFSF